MLSVNLEAKKTVDLMIERAEELNLAVAKLENDSTIIDAGVNVTEVSKRVKCTPRSVWGTGRCGHIHPRRSFKNTGPPCCEDKTDFPSISTLGSQKAGWSVSVGDFFALGSGPARAQALKPAETYEEIGYKTKQTWPSSPWKQTPCLVWR